MPMNGVSTKFVNLADPGELTFYISIVCKTIRYVKYKI
jgi:hypothetical protein